MYVYADVNVALMFMCLLCLGLWFGFDCVAGLCIVVCVGCGVVVLCCVVCCFVVFHFRLFVFQCCCFVFVQVCWWYVLFRGVYVCDVRVRRL